MKRVHTNIESWGRKSSPSFIKVTLSMEQKQIIFLSMELWDCYYLEVPGKKTTVNSTEKIIFGTPCDGRANQSITHTKYNNAAVAKRDISSTCDEEKD